MEQTVGPTTTALLSAYTQGGYQVPLWHSSIFRAVAEEFTPSMLAGAEGHEGVSYLHFEKDVSGQTVKDEVAAGGLQSLLFVSNWYDTTFLTMLAAAKAALGLSDPTQVTGAQVRDALRQLNDPEGEIVRPGAAEFARAIELLSAGKRINYQGASGPCDFDAQQVVRQRLVHWRLQGGRFEELELYDCVQRDDCPRVP
jgi:hypothetical protein